MASIPQILRTRTVLVTAFLLLQNESASFLLRFPATRKNLATLMATVKTVREQPPRPNDRTHWVTEDLLAGEHPTDRGGGEATREKLKQYLERGITHFVDLTSEGEKPDYADIAREEAAAAGVHVDYARLPIRDFGIPSAERMKRILDAIDEAVAANHKVYVHCRGGIGRTGTAVGCYLARHGWSGEDALREVNRLFQFSDRSYESYRSPETNEQEAFVRTWSW
jgi:protein-tyrosine phosphatase